MSRHLLKKSLSLFEDDTQSQSRSCNLKKGKKLKQLSNKNPKPKAVDRVKPKTNEKNNFYDQLVRNRVKYHLVKDLIDPPKSKAKNDEQQKCESVFTEKDFKDFVLNYQ